MKFSTPGEVAKIRSNQTEARTCYMNTLRKAAKREEHTPVVMTIHSEPMDVDLEKMNKEMVLDKGLDPQIIGLDYLASPTEKLEAFWVNPSDSTQMLQVGQRLKDKIKEDLKQFL
ncbi:Uncharacterized protein Adt_34000 [Abeliophyllum distichum]|uniref:Uncharacterized protein n=1 Tax=Abeliophyllum distichum TaxID=126358 RepID=A0ABD1QYV4_9LAMI